MIGLMALGFFAFLGWVSASAWKSLLKGYLNKKLSFLATFILMVSTFFWSLIAYGFAAFLIADTRHYALLVQPFLSTIAGLFLGVLAAVFWGITHNKPSGNLYFFSQSLKGAIVVTIIYWGEVTNILVQYFNISRYY